MCARDESTYGHLSHGDNAGSVSRSELHVDGIIVSMMCKQEREGYKRLGLCLTKDVPKEAE